MNKGLIHVKAGDPLDIRAPVWNAFIDAARDHQAREHMIGRTPGPDFRGVPVLVKNNSGGNLGRYSVLGISGVAFSATDDGFKQRVVFTGVTPATNSHEGKFAILAAPIDNGDIGPAVVDGSTICQVNVTDTSHKYAEVASGDSAKLASAEEGSAQILWAESGTGTKWVIVRLGNEHPDKECDYTPNADDVYIGVDTGNDDEIYHKNPVTTTKFSEFKRITGGFKMYVWDGSNCKEVDGLRWNDKGHAVQYFDPDDSNWKMLPWTYSPPE